MHAIIKYQEEQLTMFANMVESSGRDIVLGIEGRNPMPDI
jgi:hypothetical protein